NESPDATESCSAVALPEATDVGSATAPPDAVGAPAAPAAPPVASVLTALALPPLSPVVALLLLVAPPAPVPLFPPPELIVEVLPLDPVVDTGPAAAVLAPSTAGDAGEGSPRTIT